MSPVTSIAAFTRSHPLMALAAFTLFLAATLMLTSARAAAADLPAAVHPSAVTDPKDDEATDSEDDLVSTPAWAILSRLVQLDLLPAQATGIIARAVLEQSEMQHPGRACERILAHGRASIRVIERCRAALGEDAPADPAQICRRALQSPTSAQNTIQRCRAWWSGTEATPGMPPAEACRRIASAANPAEELVERCRNWLAGETPSDPPMAREACRRILAAETAPEFLVERCESLYDGAASPERPSRPERPAQLDRPNRR